MSNSRALFSTLSQTKCNFHSTLLTKNGLKALDWDVTALWFVRVLNSVRTCRISLSEVALRKLIAYFQSQAQLRYSGSLIA